MRNTTLMRSIRNLVSLTVGLAVLAPLTVQAAIELEDDDAVRSFPQAEQKIKRLKKRIKKLEADVGELQALNLPVDVDVDCSASESIGAVLAAHASGLGELTIRVSGTCAEALIVSRSRVTIEGQGAGATLQVPATATYGIVVTRGAHDVDVSNLTITGGSTATVSVSKNAHATFSNIVSQASNLGMMALDGATLEITGSTLRNNSYGAYVARSGTVIISNSIIENNTNGVIALKNGSMNLTSVLPDGSIGNGVVIRNNVLGSIARAGGLLDISDTRIENNTNVGLVVDSGSAVHFFAALNGAGNSVTGNGSVGIVAQKNSSLLFNDSTNTIAGNGIGILCQNNPSYIAPPAGPGNVSGNPGGNILGCTP